MTHHQNFQVDLGGVVEILSRNLYSGPRVFVRELLQNGCDAITARHEIDPEAPARIRFVTSGSTLRITDTGVGLSLEEARTLLATIGASSKRDELGMARSDYLGQFGIGLLSCFMVSPTITVYSRSARRQNAPVIRWIGRENGTWSADIAPAHEVPDDLDGCGTTVVLSALPGERLFDYGMLRDLLHHYGAYLPLTVTVERDSDRLDAEVISSPDAPWQMPRHQRERWCAEHFGFMPFDSFDLHVPISGVRGVAFVLADGASPGQSLHHHVYLRRMLLTAKATDLLPDWAYFVRVVIDTEHLKPTASREQLFDDDLLEHTRQQLGEETRQWLMNLARHHPEQFYAFTALHINSLKSLALHDAATRSLVASTIQYHTSVGMMTLDEVMRQHGTIRFTRTDNEYRTLEPVAAANGLCIVNAGFAFDEELLGQLALDRPEARIVELQASEVLGVLEPLGLAEEAALLPLIETAQQALDGQDVAVEIRSFDPATMPVLFLPDSDLAGRLIEDRQAQEATGPFEGLIEAVNGAKGAGGRRQQARLVFNAKTSVVNELARCVDNDSMIESAVRGFYVQSLLAGRHPMNTQARSWSTSVFSTLISQVLSSTSPQGSASPSNRATDGDTFPQPPRTHDGPEGSRDDAQ
ncbi:HSP90 family protein [Schaalia sp. Marseille-Q2122]|uniref:HSP90 family protein n=1 Tax=Schaalia sp. Marseille-Q2122 TaxID=2736604 RepID=UPI00158F060C|nr:HSP90 family protein [Schaalia sp. Marseille-Q2122]